jgi:hypothetical protein
MRTFHGFSRSTSVVGTADPTEIVIWRNPALGIDIIECHDVIRVYASGDQLAALDAVAVAFHRAAEAAVHAEQDIAERDEADAVDALADDACPTCGNRPGDGVGCDDPDGCGVGGSDSSDAATPGYAVAVDGLVVIEDAADGGAR